MNRKRYLFLTLIILVSIFFRLYINSFLQISHNLNILMLMIGLVNLVLVFIALQRSANAETGLLGALLYAISPWTAYLELSASPYIVLLTLVLVCFLINQIFHINKNFLLIQIILLIIIFLFKFHQITIFFDPGLINDINTFRGETSQTIFAPFGKVVENRYIYLSEHLIFSVLKQFTPATFFTNQARLLDFSFSPPIYLGFIIPFLFGLNKLCIKHKSRNYFIIVFFLLLPSILSKTSPDLSRLILIAPIIFFVISSGIYELFLNYKKGIYRFLLFLMLFMVVVQFFTTLSDIAVREPVRLQRHNNA